MALSAITRRYSFRGVHSLDSGVHREKYHGHQYYVEVSFEKCLVCEVDKIVTEKILSVLDGRPRVAQVIAIGGGLIHAGALLFDPMHEAAKQLAFEQPLRACRITTAALGTDAGLVGAVQWAVQQSSRS